MAMGISIVEVGMDVWVGVVAAVFEEGLGVGVEQAERRRTIMNK